MLESQENQIFTLDMSVAASHRLGTIWEREGEEESRDIILDEEV